MDNQKLKKVLIEYLRQTAKQVRGVAKRGQGKEILGKVFNRPEDTEIGIDRVGEEVLEKLLRKNGLRATIFSELETRNIRNGKDVEFYGSLDPFDGSVLYLKGFEHNWYSCLSFFDKERRPLCCGVIDVLNDKIYFTDMKESYELSGAGRKKGFYPSKNERLSERIVLASYVMSSHYSAKFLEVFGDLVKSLHPQALFYPQGGPFIYAYLAAGLVDAYVMFGEPRSEIDPGFPLAKALNCEVVSVGKDGSFKDYEFVPGVQHDKVDFLLAAANPKLRDEIINYYKSYASRNNP